MPKYSAILAQDLSQYADVEFEAPDDAAAIEYAKMMHRGEPLPGQAAAEHVEFSSAYDNLPFCERILRLSSESGATIAEDIAVHPTEPPADSDLLAALKNLYAIREAQFQRTAKADAVELLYLQAAKSAIDKAEGSAKG